MTNIVGIDGKISAKAREPSQPIVKALEELLERARSGDLVQLAFVYVDGTGVPTDAYIPYAEHGTRPQEMLSIIGGLELCKATLLAQMVDA